MNSLMQEQGTYAQAMGVLLSAVPLVHGGQYRARLDWGYRDKEANARVHGHPQSLHMERLAQDLTLYFVNDDGTLSLPGPAETGLILQTLHDIWEAVGGAARIPGDLGHFSWVWGSVR
jgi:hypothetical protein